MSQSSRIISTLKSLLKSKGIKYIEVAQYLSVSESSIKRQFTQADISLSRLEKICELLEMDITDVFEQTHVSNRLIEQLSIQQETTIVSDTKLMIVAVSALNQLSFDEIHGIYDFSEPQLIKLLLQLEKIGLIELKTNNKITTLISRTFAWQKNGPIQRYFENHVQSNFFDCQFNQPGELRVVINGMLSHSSNQIIQNKTKQLANLFSDCAYKDQKVGLERRFGSTLVVAMRPWEVPAFEKYRRKKNTKVFN